MHQAGFVAEDDVVARQGETKNRVLDEQASQSASALHIPNRKAPVLRTTQYPSTVSTQGHGDRFFHTTQLKENTDYRFTLYPGRRTGTMIVSAKDT